jgi:hypothetical protein
MKSRGVPETPPLSKMALEKAGAQIQAIGLAEYPNQQRRAGKHCKLLEYPVFDR